MAFPVIKSSIIVALLGAVGGGVAFTSGLLGNSRQADKQTSKIKNFKDLLVVSQLSPLDTNSEEGWDSILESINKGENKRLSDPDINIDLSTMDIKKLKQKCEEFFNYDFSKISEGRRNLENYRVFAFAGSLCVKKEKVSDVLDRFWGPRALKPTDDNSIWKEVLMSYDGPTIQSGIDKGIDDSSERIEVETENLSDEYIEKVKDFCEKEYLKFKDKETTEISVPVFIVEEGFCYGNWNNYRKHLENKDTKR